MGLSFLDTQNPLSGLLLKYKIGRTAREANIILLAAFVMIIAIAYMRSGSGSSNRVSQQEIDREIRQMQQEK